MPELGTCVVRDRPPTFVVVSGCRGKSFVGQGDGTTKCFVRDRQSINTPGGPASGGSRRGADRSVGVHPVGAGGRPLGHQRPSNRFMRWKSPDTSVAPTAFAERRLDAGDDSSTEIPTPILFRKPSHPVRGTQSGVGLSTPRVASCCFGEGVAIVAWRESSGSSRAFTQVVQGGPPSCVPLESWVRTSTAPVCHIAVVAVHPAIATRRPQAIAWNLGRRLVQRSPFAEESNQNPRSGLLVESPLPTSLG